MVRLMGIDPGLRFTGWGLVEVDGNRLRHVADGVIATDGDDPVPQRLRTIHDALTALLAAAPARRRQRWRRPTSTATARRR